MKATRSIPVLLVLAASAVAAVAAGDGWPQWRGPGRDGVAPEARLPERWPDRLPVLWRAPAGPGYSTPVLAAGRLFFLERRGGDEALRALDAETGAEAWSWSYPAPYEAHPYAASHGDCPKATSTVAGGRVFSFGISGILTAVEAATGKPLWKRDLGAEFGSNPLFGVAASPLVDGGLVILPVGHKESGGAMMAFRAETGETAWRSVRDGPSYCSPIAAGLAGERQAVGFTARNLVGVRVSDGKELWRHPIEVPFDETIVTPVIWNGMVVMAGRNDAGTRLLRVRKEGDGLVAEEVWRQKAPIYFSSPVVRGDLLFGIEHVTGKLFCLRLPDGAVAWKEDETRFGDYASLVLAGDRVLILDSRGKLTVIDAAGAGFRPVASIRVSEEPTYAHLVVAGSRLYVRDRKEIRCLETGTAKEEER